MRLLAPPRRPRYIALVLLGKAQAHETWRKYIYNERKGEFVREKKKKGTVLPTIV
jgi:hypothetical protein